MGLGLLFLAMFGLVFSAGLLVFRRPAMLERLQAALAPRASEPSKGTNRLLEVTPAKLETIVKPFQNMLPRSPHEVSLMQGRLIRAGFRDPSAINIFYGARVLVPILLAALATISGVYRTSPLLIYGIAAGVGFMIPEFWLGSRITDRQATIGAGLPEALDLMVICTEAGLGLDQAIGRVAKELKISQPEISDELTLVGLEQRAGRPREEALKNLAERVDIDSVRMLVNTLVQADTFGTSIAKTLRVYSDTMRLKRSQRAEEQAAKTTVKLIFPLVFFIFPALFLVVMGPAGIKLSESFHKYFQ